MLIGQLALVVAAVYTGAAIYINLAEHPARMKLDDGPLLAHWKLSYLRGFAVRASLAFVGCLLGIWAWYVSGDWRWALGAVILLANWPFIVVVIMPVNNRLSAMSVETPGADMRRLMERWGRLHAIRSGLGAAATAIFVWAMN